MFFEHEVRFNDVCGFFLLRLKIRSDNFNDDVEIPELCKKKLQIRLNLGKSWINTESIQNKPTKYTMIQESGGFSYQEFAF